MIRMKNTGDFVLELTISGAQALGTTASARTSAIVPFNGRLSAIIGRLGNAGTTGLQTTDVLVNNVSVCSPAGLLTYASGATTPTYLTANLTSNPVLVNKGDVITLQNITAVHTTPANDQSVYINIERQRSGVYNEAMQTDTIASDSDTI